MKQTTNMQRSIQYLNKIFKLLNERYFENELEMPIITIQSTPKAYGHFTPWEAYRIKESNGDVKGAVEINIGAGTLDRPIENVVSTLLHEMVHYYCYVKEIKDVSRGGQYHNKRFKAEAEKRALHLEYDNRIGWSITSPTEQLIDFIINNQLEDIRIGRNEGLSFYIGVGGKTGNSGTDTPPIKKPSSTRKYICPCCGNSFRATKELNVMCMDCDKQFIVAE